MEKENGYWIGSIAPASKKRRPHSGGNGGFCFKKERRKIEALLRGNLNKYSFCALVFKKRIKI